MYGYTMSKQLRKRRKALMVGATDSKSMILVGPDPSRYCLTGHRHVF